MATEKLYWNDPFVTEVEARVVAITAWKGTPSVVLDRTVFYPEGGGQLGDRGALAVGEVSVPVLDVQIDDEGTIHHLLAAPWAHGQTGVRGAIEVARRRDFMSQHTGQHLLSAALAVVCKAETVSSRLGADTSTIDVDRVTLDPRALAEAEALVNERVLADLPVEVTFPSSDELRALPLRRAPKVTEGIRVVTVAGLDCSPCGGTHCTRTGQVGWVHATGTERYKGGTRVTFLAGARAHADAARKEAVLRELSRELTCGVLDVGAAVGKLRSDLRAKTDAFAATRGELLRLVAARLHAERPAGATTTRIVLHREQEDLGGLRSLASALAARPDVVAFVGARDPEKGDLLVAIERGAAVTDFDCGQWFKERLSRGARGGGRPERAEGRLPATMSLEEEA